MKIIKVKDVRRQQLGLPLFTGEVEQQSPITDDEGADLSVDYVHFPKRVRNKMHVHENDQVLIVLEGNGIVADKTGEFKVSEKVCFMLNQISSNKNTMMPLKNWTIFWKPKFPLSTNLAHFYQKKTIWQSGQSWLWKGTRQKRNWMSWTRKSMSGMT